MIVEALAFGARYRPFCKQWLYFDRQCNNSVYRIPSFFPTPAHENKVIAVSSLGSRSQFSVIATDCVPCLRLADASLGSQVFPRYYYVETTADAKIKADDELIDDEDTYARYDAISHQTLESYQKRYGIDVEYSSNSLPLIPVIRYHLFQ